jgi:pyrimidine-nucleoside phosphorylase
MVELIGRKRDRGRLTPDEIAWIIGGYTADGIPDYQMSALLMAILLNGMEPDELGPWTEAMLRSGETLDLDAVDAPKVDKHSTGGVGDKISIPLAPVVAACGIAVPMMSGRGLGHTGGTLDKLESIPGFSTRVDPAQFVPQLEAVGVVMAGQTEALVPADRRIYALRDASGTVPSIPLISSSIMSKKLAEDLDGLLLDVKVGSGAFMKTRSDAETLASTMIGIGASHGTRMTAMLTDMSQPLGTAVGNANEIVESIAVLRGEGPHDVTELTLRFATEMLVLAGRRDLSAAREEAERAIASGRALEVFGDLIEWQGGDRRVVDDPGLLDTAPHEHVITAERDGYVTRCDALAIGMAAVRLGAGRSTKEDTIDAGVGFMIERKVGDTVETGDPLARVAYRDEAGLAGAVGTAAGAWTISDEPPRPVELIMGVIT